MLITTKGYCGDEGFVGHPSDNFASKVIRGGE